MIDDQSVYEGLSNLAKLQALVGLIPRYLRTEQPLFCYQFVICF